MASIASFLADKLEKLARYYARIGGKLALAGRYGIRGALYVVSAAVPIAIWWIYLLLSFWGIKRDAPCSGPSPEFCKIYSGPDGLVDLSVFLFRSSDTLGSLFPGIKNVFDGPIKFADLLLGYIPGARDIVWLVISLVRTVSEYAMNVAGWVADHASIIAGTYVLIAIILFVLALIPTLNANSLHRLYRDRLSVAFIFYERLPARVPSWLTSITSAIFTRRRRPVRGPKDPVAEDLTPLDDFKLSVISARYAPYHILNTALNIQGSKFVNQRGRNGDFFMFSRNYIGSQATGYVATKQMETIAPDLNLATAMAVSGAAASSNMGSSTIRPLTPTLTILNVRLGYWLRNPIAAVGRGANRLAAKLAEQANIYFFKEMFGRLDEKTYNVYLTDGGHIENLGIYELLKRRCKLIIAVDAEADPTMNFGSLVKLQRHARIDLGTRIELPWQAIRNATLETHQLISDGGKGIPDCDRNGPHAALGVIKYPRDEVGYLLYIKASITGDENDYVIDYKRRNPTFPHESTGDQLFTEEQFEVYRALGFHAAQRIFTGEDEVSTLAPGARSPRNLTWNSAARTNNPMKAIRRLLQL